MKIINPGKFEITIGGVTKQVIISLGLKTELYKLITSAQLDIARLHKSVFLNEEYASLIQVKDSEIKALEMAEEAVEKIDEAKAELEALYSAAMRDLEQRQHEAFSATVLEKITVSERVFTEAISCLLSERNEYGVITKKLELNDITWSTEYAEAQQELTELLHAVTEYITSALKKISEISQMVNETTNA